jgi:hypothetical protein
LAVVSLGGVHALAFEIHVVHERVETEGLCGDTAEVGFDFRTLGGRCGGEHFRQSGLHAHRGVARLRGDRLGKHGAEGAEARSIEIGHERIAGFPGARTEHPIFDRRVLCFQKPGEAGPAFFKRPAASGWIPDKMGDAEGWEFLALVPRGEAADRAGALVFPDAAADFECLRIGESGRGRLGRE